MITGIGHNSANIVDAQEAKTALANIITDLSDGDKIAKYLKHIKFDSGAMSNPPRSDEWLPALVAHYRIKKGQYDMDRITMDFVKYPPIAARVVELMAERAKV